MLKIHGKEIKFPPQWDCNPYAVLNLPNFTPTQQQIEYEYQRSWGHCSFNSVHPVNDHKFVRAHAAYDILAHKWQRMEIDKWLSRPESLAPSWSDQLYGIKVERAHKSLTSRGASEVCAKLQTNVTDDIDPDLLVDAPIIPAGTESVISSFHKRLAEINKHILALNLRLIAIPQPAIFSGSNDVKKYISVRKETNEGYQIRNVLGNILRGLATGVYHLKNVVTITSTQEQLPGTFCVFGETLSAHEFDMYLVESHQQADRYIKSFTNCEGCCICSATD